METERPDDSDVELDFGLFDGTRHTTTHRRLIDLGDTSTSIPGWPILPSGVDVSVQLASLLITHGLNNLCQTHQNSHSHLQLPKVLKSRDLLQGSRVTSPLHLIT